MTVTRTPMTTPWWTYPSSLLLGAASGLAGTLSHRIGATLILPVGLIFAFVIVGASSYWSRFFAGAIGMGLHILGASGVIWLLMGRGPGGDVLIPISSPAFSTYFDRNAGTFWLIGSLVIQLLFFCCPNRLIHRGNSSVITVTSEEYGDSTVADIQESQ